MMFPAAGMTFPPGESWTFHKMRSCGVRQLIVQVIDIFDARLTFLRRHPGSGGFGQAQGVEEVELLRGGYAGAVEGAGADVGGVFLDAGEEIEGGAGAGEGPAYMKLGGRVVYRVCDIKAFEHEVIQSTADQQIRAS